MLSRILGLFRGAPVLIRGTDALPDGHSRKISIGDPLAGGQEIVLSRVEGVLHAVDVICPHEGGRILDGPLVDGLYVICPLHNYKFDPRSGRAVGVACSDAKTYRVRERGSDCEVWT